MFNSIESDASNGLKTNGIPSTIGHSTSGYDSRLLTNSDLLNAAAISPTGAQSLPVTPSLDTASISLTGGIDKFLAADAVYTESIAAGAISSAPKLASSSPQPSRDELLFGGQLTLTSQRLEVRSNAHSGSRSQNIWRQGLSQNALNRAVGTFTANKNGRVTVDFVFDGSNRTGELAVFSVKGMGGLKRNDFIKEAARRALSGTGLGQVVIKDKTEAAQFSGSLGERNFNRGQRAKTKTVKFSPRDRFAVMFVSNGTIADVRASKRNPLLSIADFNPKGRTQIAKASNNVFAMEEARVGKSRADFNDVIFRLKGASGNVTPLQQLVTKNKDWRNDPTAQQFLRPGFSPKPKPTPSPLNPPKPNNPTPNNPNPGSGRVVRNISNNVAKFGGGSSQAQIIASGANKITIGTQTIYIGTEQVSSINQNPIVRSFDPKNPQNNWTRRDIETSGTDGRGYGLLWSGKTLYGVFSVDGTQTDGNDFRKAASGAQQNWLKSYGFGGGARIGVIGQLDPRTGKLLKAAHLSAVLSSGKTNTLTITDATVNGKGNLVIKAKSFFSPRQPDGSAKKQNPGSNASSPFDYTIEMTPDLKRVVRTAAPGWS